MAIAFGREICGELEVAQRREWLVTNGIGGYASGTVAGLLTRGYHGLLIAALKPPLQRTLLVAKTDELATYDGQTYGLSCNRWANGSVDPQGHTLIESFRLDGTMPVWEFAVADALLEKRIWMEYGENTTYVQYSLVRGSLPLQLSLKVLVNYRSYHSRTQAGNWRMNVEAVDRGVCVTAFAGATPFYLLITTSEATLVNEWYRGFELAAERDRGLNDLDDNLCAATFSACLNPHQSLTLVVSTQARPSLDSAAALNRYQQREQNLLTTWKTAHPKAAAIAPDWVQQLVLAADQFVVARPLSDDPSGKSIIAGYHWFADWGRDTMISLPGLTLATGQVNIAREILSTFARYVSRGMLPNRFPDDGNPLTDADYNTVDATLWYFEAIRQYIARTQDKTLLAELFPILAEIIDWYQRGTRFNIHLDSQDGLLYAGEAGVQLTWMDAKIGNWVVTPRTGKPVEISALWYTALHTMSQFAACLGQSGDVYLQLAAKTREGFARFWNGRKGYCFDVVDSPSGNDDSLRPNQLLAIAIPLAGGYPPLLTADQQKQVVQTCGRHLLTSHGLRSLDPHNPQYHGIYGGDQTQRDSVYHQGTVWGWLLGSFALAHLAVFQDKPQANQFLIPMAHHLSTAGLGTISEIFNGTAPMEPKGCIAQAWSVGEVLRVWMSINGGD